MMHKLNGVVCLTIEKRDQAEYEQERITVFDNESKAVIIFRRCIDFLKF